VVVGHSRAPRVNPPRIELASPRHRYAPFRWSSTKVERAAFGSRSEPRVKSNMHANENLTTHTSDRSAQYWAGLALIGMIGGLMSGLFAVGGGLIMLPLLMAFERFDQRSAAATSLAAVVPTAMVGSLTYLINHEIDLTAGALISAGAVGGAVIGSKLLKLIPLVWLRWMFIAFMLAVSGRMFLVTPVRGVFVSFSTAVALGYVVLGLVMGIASGLFGIGGGIVAVPAMVAVFGLSDLVAKGTSLLVIIPTSMVGTAANWRAKTVDVRAGLVVGLGATIGAVPGADLALILPPRLSGILFATLTVAVAGQLTVKAVRAARMPVPTAQASPPSPAIPKP